MKDEIDDLLMSMTWEEKSSLFSGNGMWETKAIDRLGIASVVMSDGPHGLRRQTGSGDHLGLNQSQPATCFPTAATIANSWDEDLGEMVGYCIGQEAVQQKVDILLGPGLNIKRNPLCGRNFEYFSEDPYLSGKMAAAYVRGIQRNGISACPKHFAVNNQEYRRMVSDSILDERTLREIYLTAFEIVVKEAKPLCLMTSYNKINGCYASENEKLLQEILIQEWGYEGFVVTDWGGGNNHTESVRTGNHLEMPGTGGDSDRELLAALQKGEISHDIIDTRLKELLRIIMFLQKSKKSDEPGCESANESVLEHHHIARRAAEESIILLKNEQELLPLSRKTSVAVIGDFAFVPRYQGAGSSMINCTQLNSMVELAAKGGYPVEGFEKGYERNRTTSGKLISQAVALAKKSDVVLLLIGLDEASESEGLDRSNMKIPDNQIELLEALAQANENVVAVISAGSAIELPWIDQCKAVIHGYLTGQAGAEAILRCLWGEVCPSGKLAETLPVRYQDVPNTAYYLVKQNQAEYREALFIGYRYCDKTGTEVRFPFGFGLSYTSFHYRNLNIKEGVVTFCIKNIGKRAGAEIAQLYVHACSMELYRADKELKGFCKVFLEAGEEATVKIVLDDKAFRYYNTGHKQWEVEAGTYEIMIGASSKDIRLSDKIVVAGTKAERWYQKEELQCYHKGEVSDVSDTEFEHLLGRKISDEVRFEKKMLLGMNDTLSQLCYAKSLIARIIYAYLNMQMKRKLRKGIPDLNLLFLFHMPFRGIAKMSNGLFTMEMAEELMKIVNGHFFKGVHGLYRAYRKKK